MTQRPALTGHSPLFAELRWFVRLRWFAGLTVLLGAVVNGTRVGFSDLQARILVVGAVILAYNLVHFVIFRRRAEAAERRGRLLLLAWLQILLDLGCLTLLTLWTGGLASPLIGLFVLHMVFASLLLPPMTSYLVATVAMAAVFTGLGLTGQWPDRHEATLVAFGWMLTLLLTVFLANHITASLRGQEQELRRQHRRTRAIVQTAADGILTINEAGVVESANPAAERIFGYEANEPIGQPIERLAPVPFREPATGAVWHEMAGQRKDGTRVPLEVAVSAVRLGERRIFTVIVRDITERKRAETTLRELNEELKRQQAALIQNEKMAAMGQMAAGVAHEISNPLANMDSVLQLLDRQPDRLKGETTSVLREQVARIHQVVRQMTYFAHPDQTCWETTSVSKLVETALEMVRLDHRVRSVELLLKLSPDACDVHVMPHAIQQVLVNLILNALDALTGETSPQLTLSTRRENAWCVIEVADNGHGIAPEHLNRVFEPFFTTKPVGEGTGLGLSISYTLVQQHGGRCEVSSTPGEGSVFSIFLPRAKTASCDREARGAAIPDSENNDG